MKRKIIKDKLPPKVLTFDIHDPEDVRLFNLLDKTRYNQSKLIKRLLSDFYDEFSITEDTPFDSLSFIVKSYIDKDETVKKFQVLNKILNRGSSSIQQIPTTPVGLSKNLSAVQSTTSNHTVVAASMANAESVSLGNEEEQRYMANMASGFDSMLE